MNTIEKVKQMAEAIAKPYIAEMNTEDIRRTFSRSLEPWMIAVGCKDVRLVCDETNNPPEAIDRGEFNAVIHFKPPETPKMVHLKLEVAPVSESLFGDMVCNEVVS